MIHRVISLLIDKGGQIQSIAQNAGRSIASVPVIRLVRATFHGLGVHDATHMAAGVAYYAVLSIFPLMLGLTAIFSLFLRYETVDNGLVSFFDTYLPASADILDINLKGISRHRDVLGVVSVVGLFWSGTAMFTAIGRGIDRSWGITKRRSIYLGTLRNIAMVGGVGVLFVLSLAVTSTLQLINAANAPDFKWSVLLDSGVISLGIRILMILLSMGVFLMVYRILPSTRTPWRYIWPGTFLATALFECAKFVFVLYLDRFGNYQAIYGSIGSVIALLVWIYIAALVVIIGAEFSYQCSRMGKSTGCP